jgi:hypothetical protein
MAGSFVGAQMRVRGRGMPLASAPDKYLLVQIAPSDGTPAAAAIASRDFGSRRFMDSFKANNCHPVDKR